MKPFKLQKQLLSPFTSIFHLENLFIKQYRKLKRVRKLICIAKEISNDQFQGLLKGWNKFQMIVCGSLNPDEELNDIIRELHQRQDVCILSKVHPMFMEIT